MSRFDVARVKSARRPLWSVMIPVYRPNVAMLRQTVASISAAASDAEAMQVALVRDASGGDEDRELTMFLEECRDRGLEVFAPEERLGIGGNWNRCIALARGDVVHILHQDDRVRPGFYRANEAGLKRAPATGASFTQHAFISAVGTVLREGHLQRAEAGVLDDWYEHIVANLAIQCPAIVVRRSVYERLGGFDESYRYCLDLEMWQRIAAAYPIWYDPSTLAEYRVHDASQTSTLSRSLTPWRETLRCLDAGLRLISPSARAASARSARCHLMRRALSDAMHFLRQRRWRPAIAGFAGLLLIGRPYDYASILAGIHPRAPATRPPAIDPTNPERRRKRVTLITEFFPINPERSVFGVFSRLRRLLEGLDRVGEVDVVFFWPAGRDATADEHITWETQVRALWPISGQVRFARAGRRRTFTDAVGDAVWALRGAVGFIEPTPSMRTSARAPVRALRKVLSQLQPDLILAHRIGTAVALWRIGEPMPPSVVDVDDLEHVKLIRLAASLPKWSDRLVTRLWAAVARYTTRRIGRIAARMIVTSDLDRTKLEALCPHSSVAVIPNTADAFASALDAQATSPVALFVGTLDYPPNLEGVAWLVAKVWPRVRQAVPDARLLIVGEGAEKLTLPPGVDGVEVLGFVKDLGPLYQVARIAVCPIHRGAGTRIKVIEAAINGRPTVATFAGAEGLSFAPDAEIVLMDDPTRFAQACIDLLVDPTLAERIGDAARRRASSVYDPEIVARQLAATCLDAISERDDRSLHHASRAGAAS